MTATADRAASGIQMLSRPKPVAKIVRRVKYTMHPASGVPARNALIRDGRSVQSPNSKPQRHLPAVTAEQASMYSPQGSLDVTGVQDVSSASARDVLLMKLRSTRPRNADAWVDYALTLSGARQNTSVSQATRMILDVARDQSQKTSARWRDVFQRVAVQYA